MSRKTYAPRWPTHPQKRPWKGFMVMAGHEVSANPKKAPLISYGPAVLGLRQDVLPYGGPEAFYQANPQLFRTGTTSRSEAYFYWAELALLGKDSLNRLFFYQSGHNDPNSAVIDFRIHLGNGTPDVGVRIQSPYFHQGMGSEKQAYDVAQGYGITDKGMILVDVWDIWYVNDPTGHAALAVAQAANEGRPYSVSPLVTGENR